MPAKKARSFCGQLQQLRAFFVGQVMLLFCDASDDIDYVRLASHQAESKLNSLWAIVARHVSCVVGGGIMCRQQFSTTTTVLGIATVLALINVTIAQDDPCSVVVPGQVFCDDFSDGSVTNDVPLDRDGNPVVWTPVPGVDEGEGDASTGDYVLTTDPGGGAFISGASHAELTDTSVRAEMQLTDGQAAIAVLARGNVETLAAYQGGINAVSGNAYIVYNQNGTPNPLRVQPANVDVQSGNVVIQFDVIGETLKLFTWNAGDEMPAEPALQVNDRRFSSGVTGVLLDSSGIGVQSTGVFRYVQVADAPIPEPSTAILCAFGMIGLLTWRRKRLSHV